jgi:hypothetical protein
LHPIGKELSIEMLIDGIEIDMPPLSLEARARTASFPIVSDQRLPLLNVGLQHILSHMILTSNIINQGLPNALWRHLKHVM